MFTAGGRRVCCLHDLCAGLKLPVSAVRELTDLLVDHERAQNAVARRRIERNNSRPQAAPVRNSRGEEFGRVTADIDADLFFNMARNKRIGWQGIFDPGLRRELLRDYPQFAVETVSGRIVSGYTGPPRTVVKKY